MIIRITKSAWSDLDIGYEYYEEKSKGLGRYFSDTIFSEIDSLQIYAGIHIKIQNHYRFLVKKFPFAIYYTIENDIVFIDAILDCRLNPASIDERLI
ncbi:MAG: hypothetical protein PQJ59_03050 [Spirochaetales bacterium]|nr:hypothetical protein [Spirochaetales bacterium]